MITRKQAREYERIAKHGKDLIKAFNLPPETNPVDLCRKLSRLENKAHRVTTNLCNTNTLHLQELNKFTGYDVEQATEEEIDTFFDKIRDKVDEILNFRAQKIDVFINHDPRGYALKIKTPPDGFYSDWGGYGIIVPDFREGN